MSKQHRSILRAISVGTAAAGLILATSGCGIAAPASASAAPQPAHSPTAPAGQAEPVPAGWVVTTDVPTGFSAALPSTAQPGDQTADNVRTRFYASAVPGHHASVVFAVDDLPDDATVTDAVLDEHLSALNDELSHVTSAQHLVADGRPTLDGRLSSSIGDQPATLLVRYQAVGRHVVTVLSTGLQADENALSTVHQQALSSVELPVFH